MANSVQDSSFKHNVKLKNALLRHKSLSRKGLSERVFGLLFSGLVYPQIWEDPEVDMQAMAIAPHHRIVTIGSGGCNMLAYLSRGPSAIDVVDLNPHHVELNRLKLAAFRYLPGYRDLLRFLGQNGNSSNSAAYDTFIRPNLDPSAALYWGRRNVTGRTRVSVFDRNIYRTGLLGRFIGLGHVVARLHGVDPRDFAKTRTLAEQRAFFDAKLAPLFERKTIRWFTARKSSLFGLGIPPQQYDELASLSQDRTVAGVLRERLENLTCNFPLQDNYFAWQAFARRYPDQHEGQLPTYLQEANYLAIRQNTDRVTVHHANFTELLENKAGASVDRYVLLDAQDWMTDDQLNALWTQISRTAAPGARVIFRTAAVKSLLEGRVSDAILDGWTYLQQQSVELGARDRSAIYGGFHIYEKKA